MRLDVFISVHSLVASRTEAKSFITAGAVKVDGNIVTKPAFEVPEDARVEVDTSGKKYVSRGGLKLEAALDAFGIDPRGRVCLDVGASSGGFTDCLLQRGAEHVTAVDSGSGQIAEKLRADSRVTVIENYNARYMKAEDFSRRHSMAVMDVSFISATYIIPQISQVLASGSDFICLVKPQFEVGRAALGKGGIVKDERARLAALDKVTGFAEDHGFITAGSIKSPITGGDGNTEYLVHFKVR